MKEAAIKWLKQARHDLDMAEKNIEIQGYDTAAFLSHQAVEKLLKAVMIVEGKTPPKTHYLDELAQQLGVSDLLEDIAELSADYMISRYPDVSNLVPYEEYDKDIATEKVNIAKNIFNALANRRRQIEESNG